MTPDESDSLSQIRDEWTARHGSHLRDLRKSRGMLQAQLAGRVDLPRSVLSNWENGSRRPTPAHLARLAQALNVTVEDLAVGTAVPTPTGPDHTAIVAREAADTFVEAEQRRYIDRFLRQVRAFDRMSSTAELSARRWASTRTAAEESRQQLLTLTRSSEETRSFGSRVGHSLAKKIRRQLDLGEAPLPTMDATADLLGVSVFLVHLGPTEAGRLRGLLVESDRLGAILLLNADLTHDSRRHVMNECVAEAVLQPPGSVIAATTPRRHGNGNVAAAARSFAYEFALPEGALVATLAVDLHPVSRLVNGTDDPSRSGDAAVSAIVEVATLYGVPAAHVWSRAGLDLTPRQTEKVLAAMNLGTHRSSLSANARHDGSWSTTSEDVPLRFLQYLIDAITEGRASLSGVADLTGIPELDIEQLLQLATSEGPPVAGDVKWFDMWHFDQVA